MTAGAIRGISHKRRVYTTHDIVSLPVQNEREAAVRDRERRIVAARLEIRFGPMSDVAQALGLVPSLPELTGDPLVDAVIKPDMYAHALLAQVLGGR